LVTAIVLVRTERERVREAAQAMLGIEGVTEVYSVTGPYDLVVMVGIASRSRRTRPPGV
jgi:DNA-binding Lrp family transcriptional regulator